MQNAIRHKRLTITLPETTLEALDRFAPKQQRSHLIDVAVSCYLEEQRRLALRESLKRGALARAQEDLDLASEWFEAEQEVWDTQLRDRGSASVPGRSQGRGSTERA